MTGKKTFLKHLQVILRSSISARGITIGLGCAIVCCLANYSDELRALENIALDACFRIRGERSTNAKIYIIAIDDPSLKQLDKPFVQISPELARVVRHLHDRGAIAIGVDLLIVESAAEMPELLAGGVGDADEMGRAVGATKNVVLSEWVMVAEETVGPLYQWLAPPLDWDDVGYVDLTVDEDFCFRSQQLRAKIDGSVHPCFALALFSKSLKLGPQWLTQPTLVLDDRAVPMNEERLLVNYLGPPGTVPRIPFHRVLEAANSGRPLLEGLSGSIVLIGADMRAHQDKQVTPFARQYTAMSLIPTSWIGNKPELMAGVEVHAHILATLMDEAYIITPFILNTPLLLLVTGVVLGSILIRVNLEKGLWITLLHHFAWKIVCILAFCVFNWRIEMAAMLFLGPMVYVTVFGLRWRWIRKMMGMFKSEAIAKAMELNPGDLDLRGQEQIVTIFFSDIRGFTTISEGSEPRFVVKLLNDYFTAIVPVIEQHGGVVNQYMGDGVMVIFGAPFPQHDHAYRAVLTGCSVLRKVHEMKDHWAEMGIENFRIGVGIHTGMAITGTVGSPQRLDYSAIGDTVNTASRIESSTKELGVELLISEQTFESITPDQREELGLSCTPHQITVKGKQEALSVYSIQFAD